MTTSDTYPGTCPQCLAAVSTHEISSGGSFPGVLRCQTCAETECAREQGRTMRPIPVVLLHPDTRKALVVGLLQSLMSEAERGEIISLAIVVEGAGTVSFSQAGWSDDVARAIGSLDLIKAKWLKDWMSDT